MWYSPGIWAFLLLLKNQEFSPTPGNIEFFDMIATDLRLAPIDAAQRAASIGISEIAQNAKSTFFWACKVITCCAALRAAQPSPPFLPSLFSLPHPLLPFSPPFPLKARPQPGSGLLAQTAGRGWGTHQDGTWPGPGFVPLASENLQKKWRIFVNQGYQTL